MKNKTYLLLGSNLKQPATQINKARKQIQLKLGPVLRLSNVYETAAWGNPDQKPFLNQVIMISTALTPEETMRTILEIEESMGRIRTKKNAPRIIDIDILFYNKKVLQTEILTLPHPLLQERKFVLVPLNEIAPLFVHPVLKKSIHQLLLDCKDSLSVKKN